MAKDLEKQAASKNLRLTLLRGDGRGGQTKNGSEAGKDRLGLLESGGLRKRMAAWSANRLKQEAK